jgi:hypothetical protein
MSVYRTAAESEAPKSPSGMLVYDSVDRASTSSSVVALFKIVTLPAAVAALLSVMVNGTAGAVGLVAGIGFGIVTSRRKKHRATLTVEDGTLTIARRGRTERIALDDLLNVELDIKTIQRVQEGGAIPHTRFINSTVGPEVDTGRIVIVSSSSRVALSDDYLAHIDATEWFGKIRVFLRKHGWVPLDERSQTTPDEEDDAPEVA